MASIADCGLTIDDSSSDWGWHDWTIRLSHWIIEAVRQFECRIAAIGTAPMNRSTGNWQSATVAGSVRK
jgi:hypothetical protein